MKKFFLVCLLSVFTSVAYSQISNSQISNSQVEETQRYQSMLSTSTRTLVISTTNYSSNTIRVFKKELRGWPEKVLSANVDTIQKTFTIIHNGLLYKKEMEDFLNKYSIKNSSIISYN